MSGLPTALRRQLESAVKQARKIAEVGARKALEALAVHEPDPYRHMDEAQRDLRRKLRAQAKQLGRWREPDAAGRLRDQAPRREACLRPMAPAALCPLSAGEQSPHLAGARGVRVAGRLRGTCAVARAEGCVGRGGPLRCEGTARDLPRRRPGGRGGTARGRPQSAHPARHRLAGGSVHRQRQPRLVLPILAGGAEGRGQRRRQQDRRGRTAGGHAVVHRRLHGGLPPR